MSEGVSILGPDGRPIQSPRANRYAALNGNHYAQYDAADIFSQHTATWTPYLWSADSGLNPFRDRIVARARDLALNDGWAAGSVTRVLDNAIGASLRPITKPDYRWLAAYTGNPAFDHQWAKEFARAVDGHWRTWADDPARYCDAARFLTFSQMMRVAFRHKLIDNDALAEIAWLPERVAPGAARYATAVQLIDPDRLSNPQLRFDQQSMRGGVEVDERGAAVAYWIREAHQGDWWAAQKSLHWQRIPRETSWGRPVVVHDFDHDRAGQHRGGNGIFTPVMQRLKMLIKYDGTEVDAAIINAIFAAYIESPFDPQLVGEALGDSDELSRYQADRKDFHDERKIALGGARIPILFPGEKINAVSAQRPASNFAAFEGAVLRNVASGMGLSAQQVSNDWSDVNYSSARAALLEAWKTLSRRRHDFAIGFAAPIRAAWLEETFEVDDLPMPNDAPPFMECRAAYSRAKWLGPGRGWVDPVAEKQGAVIGMDAGLSTLEDECAEQALEWEEVLEQRAYELRRFDELKIPRPEWAGQFTATQAAKAPEVL